MECDFDSVNFHGHFDLTRLQALFLEARRDVMVMVYVKSFEMISKVSNVKIQSTLLKVFFDYWNKFDIR